MRLISGIGMDLIELDRIDGALQRNSRFADRILTEREKRVFNQLPNPKRKVEYLAGRFAAKEAFAKAAGCGIGKLGFHDIEILNGESGAPILSAAGYERHRIFVSITHSRAYAAAQVVLEDADGQETLHN